MLVNILLATTVISLLSLVGVVILVKKDLMSAKWLRILISFAAGVMLSVSFVELIPEAIHHGSVEGSLAYVLFGIIAFFVLEKFIHHVHCHKPHVHTKPAGILVLVGDTLHNFFDGLGIAAAFMVNPVAGISTTIAIAAHEIPQEIADFSVLIHSGFKPAKALLFNFVTALTSIAGGLVGFYALSTIDGLQPYFLSLTAGMFIYIALSDLIPELHTHNKQDWFTALAPFLAGLILIWGIIDLTHGDDLHSHSHGDEYHLEEDHHDDDDHDDEDEHEDEQRL